MMTKFFLIVLNSCNECFSKTSQTAYWNYIDFEGPSPDEIALLWGSWDTFNIYLKA